MIDLSTRQIWAVALAVFGALNGILVSLLFGFSQTDLWLLPGLYFVELGLLGALATVATWQTIPMWEPYLWAIAGVMLVFVILGAWSIGLFLIPALFAYLTAAGLRSMPEDTLRGRGRGWLLAGMVLPMAVVLLRNWYFLAVGVAVLFMLAFSLALGTDRKNQVKQLVTFFQFAIIQALLMLLGVAYG
jgi:MFS family permease